MSSNQNIQPVNVEFSSSDFLSAIFTGHSIKLISYISELREEKTQDAVHNARVALRVINSHLVTFSPFLRRKPTTDLQTQLNWLNSKIAGIRNFDVMISMVEKVENTQVKQGLLTRLAIERLAQELKLNKALESSKIDSTLKALTNYALNPPLRQKFQKLSSKKSKTKITSAISHTWVLLFESLERLPKRPKPKQLHRVRIAAKECRYAYEAAAESDLLQSPHIQAWTKHLQQRLGQVQDVQMIRKWIKAQPDLDTITRTQALIYFTPKLPQRKQLLTGVSQTPQ